MNTLFALLLSMGLVVSPAPKFFAEVDRTEDNDIAVTLVYVDRGYREDVYVFDIPQVENDYEPTYNEWKEDGEDLDIDVAYGTFYGGFYAVNNHGEKVYLYQFKSYDNNVWWCLEESEIGFRPTDGNQYALVYYQNGTTKENHECPEEYDCDCYSYDDIFLGVYPM